jgi:hypothetical protein
MFSVVSRHLNMFVCTVCETGAFTLKKIPGIVHSFVQKYVFGLFWTERPSNGAMSCDSMLEADQIEEVSDIVTVGQEHSVWGPYPLSCTG